MWTGCGKEWGVAGLYGGVAARGSKGDDGCGKVGNRVLDEFLNYGEGDMCG